ncbi:MAG TPA: hypothetical protein VEX14_17110, partial [Burkholderiaceae bacterium]|nr:hypothetical protein [Burkholderiaceae bacterium]
MRVVERRFFSRQAIQRTAPLGLGAVDAAGDGKLALALAHSGVVPALRRGTLGFQPFATLRIVGRSIGRPSGDGRQAAHKDQDPKSFRHGSG